MASRYFDILEDTLQRSCERVPKCLVANLRSITGPTSYAHLRAFSPTPVRMTVSSVALFVFRLFALCQVVLLE